MSGLTPWYPISTNPSWDGNYEVDPGDAIGTRMVFWDGWHWQMSDRQPLPFQISVNFPPNTRWRGVTGAWVTKWGHNIDERRALQRLINGI